MLTMESLLVQPDEFAKILTRNLYKSVVDKTTEELMEMLKPVVRKQVEVSLTNLKTYMERDYFQGALLLKVILDGEPLEN